MEEILIVDGYNIIGAAQGLESFGNDQLEEARDWLIDQLAEYQGFTGVKVYLIFDAHQIPGIGKRFKQKRIEILFTRENETADERIEKLVRELKRIQRRIYVATSDHTEQWVIFGQGALRKSARELIMELKKTEHEIKATLKEQQEAEHNRSFFLKPEIRELFEKWRREK